MTLVHHELCFGCGRVNLFGLLLELEPVGGDAVAGRGFLKQDHQGPERGNAHPGVLATALTEAMALACGPRAEPEAVTVEFVAPARVGTFVHLHARVESRNGVIAQTTATATGDDQRPLARARAKFRA
jgi:acyl-coenzyme A thioesterase PaaI-like protein